MVGSGTHMALRTGFYPGIGTPVDAGMRGIGTPLEHIVAERLSLVLVRGLGKQLCRDLSTLSMIPTWTYRCRTKIASMMRIMILGLVALAIYNSRRLFLLLAPALF